MLDCRIEKVQIDIDLLDPHFGQVTTNNIYNINVNPLAIPLQIQGMDLAEAQRS